MMILAALVLVCASGSIQMDPSESVPVTADNFVRAETDMYFAMFAKRGAFGRFLHLRELPLENTGVRPNRDTLYSEAVFDLNAGAVTITTPDPGERFMSMQVIDQDHFTRAVFYGAGSHTFDKGEIGTRYLFLAVRTLVDPNDASDMEEAHALQDAIEVRQKSPGGFEAPPWDTTSQKAVRDSLLALNEALPDLRGAFGDRGQVDPVRHLIGTASAWGGNPDRDAIYLTVTPGNNDGNTPYTLNVREVPVDAFWSVTVYDAQGHFQKNLLNMYNISSITADKNPDGSVTIQFGNCDGKVANCLPIMSGWNYLVRLYRPRAEVLDGTWSFPEARPLH